MIVDVGGDDEFVGLCDFEEAEEAAFDSFDGADNRAKQRLAGGGFFDRRPEVVDLVDGRGDLSGHAATQIGERLLNRCELIARSGVGFVGDDVYADHGIGFCQIFRGLEVAAVEGERLQHVGWREMRREGERKTESGGELRAEEAGAEEPHRNLKSRARYGANSLAGFGGFKIVQEFCDVLRKTIRTVGGVAAERTSGGDVSAGSATESEIDAAGIKRRERAELLGNDER